MGLEILSVFSVSHLQCVVMSGGYLKLVKDGLMLTCFMGIT